MADVPRTDRVTPGALESRPGRVYFPELDGLRFVAFVLVYLFHGGVPGRILTPMVGRTAAAALRQNGSERAARWAWWLQRPLYAMTAWLLCRDHLGLGTTARRT